MDMSKYSNEGRRWSEILLVVWSMNGSLKIEKLIAV